MESDEYQELLNSPEWKARRADILKDRGYNCEDCGSCLGLEVHHKGGYIRDRYGELLHPAEYSDYRLEVLCSRCHAERHGRLSEQPAKSAPAITRPPKAALQLADCETEFEAWLVSTGMVLPEQWDRNLYPLPWLWNEFSGDFIKEREARPS
jgi:hypothetical protein